MRFEAAPLPAYPKPRPTHRQTIAWGLARLPDGGLGSGGAGKAKRRAYASEEGAGWP